MTYSYFEHLLIFNATERNLFVAFNSREHLRLRIIFIEYATEPILAGDWPENVRAIDILAFKAAFQQHFIAGGLHLIHNIAY